MVKAGAPAQLEPYADPQWWKTDLLPDPLRHNSGHEGSHTFLTNEFVTALVENRKPVVDVYTAVALTRRPGSWHISRHCEAGSR